MYGIQVSKQMPYMYTQHPCADLGLGTPRSKSRGVTSSDNDGRHGSEDSSEADNGQKTSATLSRHGMSVPELRRRGSARSSALLFSAS